MTISMQEDHLMFLTMKGVIELFASCSTGHGKSEKETRTGERKGGSRKGKGKKTQPA